MAGTIDSSLIKFVLDALPSEISFVDSEDTVRYFNKNGDRVFPRPPGVLGRRVQQCHPKESLGKVEAILKSFRDGSMDKAEFWINHKGRRILIRYFPVKDEKGEYRGCLEVTEDVTEIQKLKGEKRLL